MNIFVTNPDPHKSATELPDKHVVKMPLETCQMLSIIYSKWYYDWGELYKKDGTAYATEKGAFRNHPCTKWVAAHDDNLQWLLQHGISLCNEYESRFNKKHACERTIRLASLVAPDGCPEKHKPFVRAMPDDLKYDTTVDTVTAYRMYLSTKPWIHSNYSRTVHKPSWLDPTLAQEGL